MLSGDISAASEDINTYFVQIEAELKLIVARDT